MQLLKEKYSYKPVAILFGVPFNDPKVLHHKNCKKISSLLARPFDVVKTTLECQAIPAPITSS